MHSPNIGDFRKSLARMFSEFLIIGPKLYQEIEQIGYVCVALPIDGKAKQ